MANAVWPSSLPQDQFVGLSYRFAPAVLRTPVDGGPAKLRRLYTSAYQPIDIPIVLTNVQMTLLNMFFRDTIFLGSLPFDWEDPATDELVTMQFREPPTFAMVATNATTRVWSGQMALEILP